eukprot:4820417-Alexandrium_andersonii.AAC.1
MSCDDVLGPGNRSRLKGWRALLSEAELSREVCIVNTMQTPGRTAVPKHCLLYTSDAADDM